MKRYLAWRCKLSNEFDRAARLAVQDAGIGRYCPQLLADYLVLAASPPSAKSASLLRLSSLPAALTKGYIGAAGSSSSDAAAGDAVAVAEEDVLGGEPLSNDAAAALRQGAFALYGACSPTEV